MKPLRSMFKSPENLLRANFKALDKSEVRVLLSRLLGAEYSAHPIKSNKRLTAYFLRLKWKRVKVAKHYESIGGVIDPIAKQWALPIGKKWPGTIVLIKDRVQIKT